MRLDGGTRVLLVLLAAAAAFFKVPVPVLTIAPTLSPFATSFSTTTSSLSHAPTPSPALPSSSVPIPFLTPTLSPSVPPYRPVTSSTTRTPSPASSPTPPAARGPRALAPAARAPPPPSDGVAYALSAWAGGGAGGGAVAVVDLGDGARWLRELHVAAAAPLLLWRAPNVSARGSAPPWLERQRAYVLAARSPVRLVAFINIDVHDVIPLADPDLTAVYDMDHRHVQLSSTAPIVLSAARAPPYEGRLHVSLSASFFWLNERHNSIGSILLLETRGRRTTIRATNDYEDVTIIHNISSDHSSNSCPVKIS